MDRDELGRIVREAVVGAHRFVWWEELPEPDKEADRRIGEAVARAVIEQCALVAEAEPLPGPMSPEQHAQYVKLHPSVEDVADACVVATKACIAKNIRALTGCML